MPTYTRTPLLVQVFTLSILCDNPDRFAQVEKLIRYLKDIQSARVSVIKNESEYIYVHACDIAEADLNLLMATLGWVEGLEDVDCALTGHGTSPDLPWVGNTDPHCLLAALDIAQREAHERKFSFDKTAGE